MYPDRSPPPGPPAIPPGALRFVLVCYALAFVGVAGALALGARRRAGAFGVLAAIGVAFGAVTVFVLWCRRVARLALGFARRRARVPARPAGGGREREPANDPHPRAAS